MPPPVFGSSRRFSAVAVASGHRPFPAFLGGGGCFRSSATPPIRRLCLALIRQRRIFGCVRFFGVSGFSVALGLSGRAASSLFRALRLALPAACAGLFPLFGPRPAPGPLSALSLSPSRSADPFAGPAPRRPHALRRAESPLFDAPNAYPDREHGVQRRHTRVCTVSLGINLSICESSLCGVHSSPCECSGRPC